MQKPEIINQAILCVGPIGEPVTGQSLATEVWARNSSFDIVKINNNFQAYSRFKRIRQSFITLIRVFKTVNSSRIDAMYLSLKRSNLGLLVDYLYILIFLPVVLTRAL